ncbi:phosphoglycerate mutase [Rhodoferax sp.]|uniref:phosphoglycerate mutase n=1 Tax=Rhodoferax sp. TaxID=50421 RepID=UPI002842079D|nr:phosphoglycerate mutase [Rhodoferax sp.]MDR3371266.1 phosphoglycerate mutase [Rhodoferax sp.]
MHLIIPYAAINSEGFADAMRHLQLPNLQKLLTRLSPLPLDVGDESSLTPPHERTLARALNLNAGDGQFPWAARQAQRLGLDSAGSAWAFITLCHWQINTGHVTMSPLPQLPQAESDELRAAMQPYFAEDGITLHAYEAGCWLAQADIFANLASASPDRVIGRNLQAWMPESKQAAPLRRLQNEMQMLLYTHPVNDARDAHGLAPINSVWFSGTGALPANYQAPDAQTQPLVLDTLRDAALANDTATWLKAWQKLDASEIAVLLQSATSGQRIQLTLCGERSSQCWHTQPQPVWQKFKHIFSSQPLHSLLEKL